MRFLTFIFFFIFITNSFSQYLKVESVSSAFCQGGNLNGLQESDTLSVHSFVDIYQGGHLYLQNSTGWGFYLGAGKYNIDSCYRIYKKIFTDYDSVKVIVNRIYPSGMKETLFKGTSMLSRGATQDTHYSKGYIAFSNTDYRGERILSVGDQLTLQWRDPNPTSGRYIVVFKNLYDDIICYRVVNSCSLNINLSTLPLNNHEPVICTVYSDDYRMSTMALIEW